MLRILLFVLGITSMLRAQEIQVVFTPILGGEELVFSGADAGAELVKKHQGLSVETLRFYLSHIVLLKDDTIVHRAAQQHYLLDAELPESLRLPLQTMVDYDQLRFTLGVDSLTAASGAFGGDLDPTNGMYWTWRSGYINFKLEGTSPECPARKNRFQFHVGGFQGPFNSEREVRLKVNPGATVPIQINLDLFFERTDISKNYQIMSPNEESATLADLLVNLFQVPAPQ